MKEKSLSVRVTKYIVSYGLAIIWLIPIVWMLFVALSEEGVVITNFVEWFLPPYSLDSFAAIMFGTRLFRWMFNSFVVASSATFFVLLTASMGAFAISIINFRFKELVFTLFIIGILVPIQVNVIPLYNIAQEMGLVNSYAALALPRIAIPLGVIILRNFFDSIPKSLIESAKIDGASWFTIYLKIVLPLSQAALAAVGIFTFIMTWNDFLWPLIITTREVMYTLPVGIPTFLDVFRPDYVIPMTVNMLAAFPAIVIYLIFQRKIIEGLKMTGIKG